LGRVTLLGAYWCGPLEAESRVLHQHGAVFSVQEVGARSPRHERRALAPSLRLAWWWASFCFVRFGRSPWVIGGVVRSSSPFGVHVCQPFTAADVVSLSVSAVSVRPSVGLPLVAVSDSEVLVVVTGENLRTASGCSVRTIMSWIRLPRFRFNGIYVNSRAQRA
jgi:hypothetical protein